MSEKKVFKIQVTFEVTEENEQDAKDTLSNWLDDAFVALDDDDTYNVACPFNEFVVSRPKSQKNSG